ALGAPADPQLLAAAERAGEEHRVFEGDERRGTRQAVGLEGPAQQPAAREYGERARGWRLGRARYHPEQPQGGRERHGFLLQAQRAAEVGELVWRLAPMPRHLALRVAEVGTVELADAVVGQ